MYIGKYAMKYRMNKPNKNNNTYWGDGGRNWWDNESISESIEGKLLTKEDLVKVGSMECSFSNA